jgi:Putative serine esterase (DUF676)
LREKHPEESLHILIAKRNSGSFTYDGVELGGERVCQEIEEELEKLAREGLTIKKLSIVGYSLGGLVARYAVGLLYSRGLFDKLEPMVSFKPPASSNYILLIIRRTSRLLQHLTSGSGLHCVAGIITHGTSLEHERYLCLVDNSL